MFFSIFYFSNFIVNINKKLYYRFMICWKCHKEITDIASNEVYRTSECLFCHSDLHCCKGCKFYSTESHFECREDIIDPISDKERANFCEYFSPVTSIEETDSSKEDAAISAFNALFGGGICL